MSVEALKKLEKYAGPEGPVVLVIMDGVAIGKYEEGDMVAKASTPNLDWLKENSLYTELRAHGLAVGMPSDDDMGNSEVGHNAIGCGRVFDQGASLVQNAVDSGALYEGETWRGLVDNCKTNDSTLHFLGLLSDGNVHTHINHLFAMLRKAKEEGVKTVRSHILLDGRDVPPTSALVYIEQLEEVLKELNEDGSVDYAIASGGGRLKITMDRYEAEWPMVEMGWQVHVKGEGPEFASAREAVESHRKDNPGVVDQDLPPFVIVKDGKPVGPIVDGDSVILCNFRGDRAIEICRAFDEEDFTPFDRGPKPNVKFAGMMQYDGDLKIPRNFLVIPPAIDRTVGEYLAATGLRQYAISETQKYGHVTYFFNGNKSGKFNDELEEYVELTSDLVPFEERPWMKGAEITDRTVAAIRSGDFEFVRLNYPNGDMVGHTGNCLAVEISVETVDLGLARLIKAVKATKGILVVSADHGNADDMYQRDKSGNIVLDEHGQPGAKTSHSLNPVPAYIYDPSGQSKARLVDIEEPGISNLTATCVKLLGYEPPDFYNPSLVEVG